MRKQFFDMPIGTLPLARNISTVKFFAFCSMLLALCFPVEAQQLEKAPRIGYIASAGPDAAGTNRGAFQQGLRDLGYIEGKNIVIEFRYLEGMLNRVPTVVAELVRLKVDVLVAISPLAIRIAKETTKTVPIVMVTTTDPVATGLIDSLARPGGNVTGITRLTRELSGKRLELLKEALPQISRVGVLWNANVGDVNDYESAAAVLKIQIQPLEVKGSNPDFERVFREAIKKRVSALIALRTGVLLSHQRQIAGMAIQNRLPSMFEGSQSVEAGGLMSYSASEAESFRRAAVYVDKILKGAKPADLPVEQPTKFEFVINLKTAKQIGLTIPPNVLARADKVIR
jgi:putative tryptophan/tyrosine transport system substrate-binding protein